MFKLLANATAALSLLAGASVATPALSAEKAKSHSARSAEKSKSDKANCPYAHQKKANRATVAAPKAQPARGITLVEHRKRDIQILSFGP